jgi:hypothetical protein
VEPDGHSLIEAEPFARCIAGDPAMALYDVTGDLDGSGVSGVDGGSNLSSLGGAIRFGELVPGGVIPHALQIDIDAPNLYPGSATVHCYRPPATKCDTAPPVPYSGTNPDLRMGALLALPSGLDLKTLNLSPAGLILATAFQDYGAYVANDAARSVNNIVTEAGPSGSVAGVMTVTKTTCTVDQVGEFQQVWNTPFETCGANGTDPWSQDIETIFAHLEIVTNNDVGQSPFGGGGTPIVAPAPPL